MVSVDEKPSAQASERVTGYGETNSAKIVRLHETPQRRVTLNRFAALQVTTGEIKTNKIIRKPREEFLQPMDQMGGRLLGMVNATGSSTTAGITKNATPGSRKIRTCLLLGRARD